MTNCKSYKKVDWTDFELSPSLQFVKNISEIHLTSEMVFKK
jgi:hypothetical protein